MLWPSEPGTLSEGIFLLRVLRGEAVRDSLGFWGGHLICPQPVVPPTVHWVWCQGLGQGQDRPPRPCEVCRAEMEETGHRNVLIDIDDALRTSEWAEFQEGTHTALP